MSNHRWFLVIVSFLVVVSLACNLSNKVNNASTPTQPPEAVQVQTDGSQPATEQQQAQQQEQQQAEAPPAQVIIITATPEPTAIPSTPLSIWQGLSSLNSYRLTIRTVANGPTALDMNQMSMLVESGSDGNSSHTHNETVMSSADDPEVATSSSDHYVVGNRTCDLTSDSDEVTVSDEDPMAQDMLEAWFKLFDLQPMVNDPVFVGAEMLNGVMTNHFTFTVEGLGVESGAEVVSSSGEYWLAQDGQYVVKYSAVLETRDGPAGDPNTQTVHTEFYIEVTDINQPIVISMPAGCQ